MSDPDSDQESRPTRIRIRNKWCGSTSLWTLQGWDLENSTFKTHFTPSTIYNTAKIRFLWKSWKNVTIHYFFISFINIKYESRLFFSIHLLHKLFTGNGSNGDLWLAKLGLVAGVDYITHHSYLAPSTWFYVWSLFSLSNTFIVYIIIIIYYPRDEDPVFGSLGPDLWKIFKIPSNKFSR